MAPSTAPMQASRSSVRLQVSLASQSTQSTRTNTSQLFRMLDTAWRAVSSAKHQAGPGRRRGGG